jgi:hypothetical protein
MAWEQLELGSATFNEECVQISDPTYRVSAIWVCRHFIQAIRTCLEMEPDRAQLVFKAFLHDLGSYYEVVVKYDPEDEVPVEYAFKCEGKVFTTWDKMARISFATAKPFNPRKASGL